MILMNAGHMKTCGGNIGLAVARQGGILLEWLARHAIPYGAIWFGKPQADFYQENVLARSRSKTAPDNLSKGSEHG